MIKTNVYVIIVTYNAMKWIDKCLNSLSSSTINSIPVIIDNNSKDDTVNYLKTNYPGVHVIENKENRGFGQANNQGIEYAYVHGASHFFLLNQDAWVEPDAIEKLIYIQDSYDFAIVSPIHMNGNGNLMDYSFFYKIVIDEINREYVSDLCNGTLKAYYKAEKINAAAWLLSRRTIDTLGGFDPAFFHYGEDGNYCQRVKYHGEEIVFVPNSFIHHDRERQGNIQVYNKNSTLMALMYEYSDINKKLIQPSLSRLSLHLYNLKCLLGYLLKGKMDKCSNILNSYAIFIKKIPQMRHNMKTNKSKGALWLDINKYDLNR